jgi:hypothetical protein
MFNSRRAPILSLLILGALGLSACDDKGSVDGKAEANKAETDKPESNQPSAEASAEAPKNNPSDASESTDVADKMKALEDPFKKDDSKPDDSKPKAPDDMKAALEDPFKKPAE